ncbi:agrin-like [Dermatophagoides pteronyssinus]|uniref:Uncharacterized protein n=2 Tax=Dermatophagoides pteronyssinus TaxID=6956 RepID=A0ABQ8JS80_DERPT|nr:agrin-like [Dermatophagoides pteronyssinus]KAH9425464.1 hypothetical protein DERP_006072 [Dermatophagoides pteronyssinus]
MNYILFIIFGFLAINIDCQSSSTSTTLTSFRLRRRCPTIFPTYTQLMNSNSIVLIGIVEQIRPLDNIDYDESSLNRQQQQQQSIRQQQQQQSSNYIANVLVRRVLHGQRSLQHQRIQVTGFNPIESKTSSGSSWCYPNTRQGDSWIFVLQPINYPDYFRLNSSLIRITLTNIERFDSIIADQPYGLRPDFPELPCERKYCPNNGNCINDQYSSDGGRCECIQHCNQIKYQPICGSDDETYNNECELRLRSCRSNKNLFVKSINSCYYYRPNSITSSSSSSSYRTIPSIQNRYQTHRTTTTTTTTSNNIEPLSSAASNDRYHHTIMTNQRSYSY